MGGGIGISDLPGGGGGNGCSSALATVSGSAVTAATARGAAPRVDSAAARAARRDSRRDKGPGQAVTDASPILAEKPSRSTTAASKDLWSKRSLLETTSPNSCAPRFRSG